MNQQRQVQRMIIFMVVFMIVNSFYIMYMATAATFDVTKFGAKGDGMTDDSNAFKGAWNAVCGDKSSSSSSQLIVPGGKTFLLHPMQFNGPCIPSKLNIQMKGNIVGPTSMRGWIGCAGGSIWLYFSSINNLIIEGPGHFDGQGSVWWNSYSNSNSNSSVRTPQTCSSTPTALHFNGCNGLQLRGTRHVNSPRQHIAIQGSTNVDIGHISIFASQHSHNTDGIDIASVSHLHIHDSSIQTGDDCVAINGGSFDVNVTGVSCGPGHGISIGSLGENGDHDTVQGVHVSYCNISGTQNGVRIKTVPGGSGFAKEIVFEHIQLRNVQNPIIIDQHYCLGQPPSCRSSVRSAVAVSSVTYKRIKGSSATPLAIILNCSPTTPCSDIRMDHVSITAGSSKNVSSLCSNVVHETFTATSPAVFCH